MKTVPEIKHLKAELRKIYLHKRNSIDPAIMKIWDEQIFQRLLKLPSFAKASLIMTYLSIRSEVDTFKLVHYLLEAGKRVAVPCTEIKSRTLTPSEIKDLQADLCTGNFKILEPAPHRMKPVNLTEIDLCIVPGIVFDLSGHRLGYSHGYYDRFLARLSPHTITVGLTYESQIIEKLPTELWDINVHYVITQERTIKCK